MGSLHIAGQSTGGQHGQPTARVSGSADLRDRTKSRTLRGRLSRHYFGQHNAFSALPAYDLVTGWGSPQAGLITALNPSQAANFTQLQIVVFTGSDDLRNDSDLQVSFKGVSNSNRSA